MTHLITFNRQEVWKLNTLVKSWNSSSKASILSFDLQKEIGTWACSQFWAQTRFWTMRGERELRNGSSMHLPVLNANSEATIETGTANTTLAILDSTWYLFELAFHHPKISNFTSLLLSQFLAKYFSISLLHPHYKKNGLLQRAKTTAKAQKTAAKGPFGLLRQFYPPALRCRNSSITTVTKNAAINLPFNSAFCLLQQAKNRHHMRLPFGQVAF